MDTTELKSNSHASKESQNKKVREKRKSVVSEKPIVKKRTVGEWISDFKNSGDADALKKEIKDKVVFPLLSKGIKDAFVKIVDTFIPGSGNYVSSSINNVSASYVSYDRFSSNNNNNGQQNSNNRYLNSGSTPFKKDVVYKSKEDAMDVLNALHNLRDEFGLVSVADLKDLSDIPSDYTDSRYGWTDISSAQIIEIGDGNYLLKLPKASWF